VPNLHTRKAAMAAISLPCDHTLTEYILSPSPVLVNMALYKLYAWSVYFGHQFNASKNPFRLILRCSSCSRSVTEIPSQRSGMISLTVVYRVSPKPTTLGNGNK